jgi:acetyl-CoA acyltransferase 1
MPRPCSTQKNPDDVVITLAIRTPLTKGFKGGFKDTDLDYMVYALLKKVAEQSKLDPSVVEDVCFGNVRKSQKWPSSPTSILIMTTG